jgi:hypothetical protein
VLIDPDPPPPQIFLDDLNVQAGINALVRVPESDEHMYRRPMMGILRFMFPPRDGYEVIQEVEGDISRSDFAVLKVLQRPGVVLTSTRSCMLSASHKRSPGKARKISS